MIHHILKNGTEVADVVGRVIAQEDFELLYMVIDQIEERKQKDD